MKIVIDLCKDRENSRQIYHDYKVEDEVMLKTNQVFKYEKPYKLMYGILHTLQLWYIPDRLNTRCLKPYHT